MNLIPYTLEARFSSQGLLIPRSSEKSGTKVWESKTCELLAKEVQMIIHLHYNPFQIINCCEIPAKTYDVLSGQSRIFEGIEELKSDPFDRCFS